MTTPQTKGTILITGAGGLVGGQIIREALESGFSVRIAARSASSASRTASRFPSHASRLSTAVVADMTTAASYAPAFADGAITAVVHAASPFVLAPRDNVQDLLVPATRGATAILDAVRAYGGGAGKVRSVVATSSFAAVVDVGRGRREGHTYTEADWNPATWEEAAAAADGVVAYCASKALAERGMWAWMDDAQRKGGGGAAVGFGLTTICPPWVFGPYAWELSDTKGLSESIGLLDRILDAEAVPPFDFGGYADAREVAAAHVRAIERPEMAAGRRFIVGQGFRYQAAVDAAREALPELRGRLPVGTPGEWVDAYEIDGGAAERVLGVRYGRLRDTVRDTYVQLLRARELEGGGEGVRG
ncbi:NAD(P)-binding protein [Hypoxylon fragiforme]|uniref:NAD(P)-binding protein n=1 Tax=Hypoxylon fragiforme TaxID=63214 RepID=UPI0020C61CCE|nr:NAD(P)-binding protein [Hypoxylon fragiforme]KAI2610023.1 NAD(P)-binding protein [Hypoxylon fragiforme]